MQHNQREIVFQTSAIGAFLVKQAKEYSALGCLTTLSNMLSAPLTKISAIDLTTPFTQFSTNLQLFLEKNFEKIDRQETCKQKFSLPSQYVVASAINVALFVNQKNYSYSSGVKFTRKIAEIFDLVEDDKETFLFVANLINLLLDEGYFRYKHVETLLTLGIGSEQLHKAIHRLFLYSNDKDFISSPILAPSFLSGLSFNEIVIVKTIFYLLQTFELRDASKTPGRKPKFLASNLITIDTAYVEDVVLLYSSIYAASDHYATLYRRPFYVALSDMLGTIWL